MSKEDATTDQEAVVEAGGEAKKAIVDTAAEASQLGAKLPADPAREPEFLDVCHVTAKKKDKKKVKKAKRRGADQEKVEVNLQVAP